MGALKDGRSVVGEGGRVIGEKGGRGRAVFVDRTAAGEEIGGDAVPSGVGSDLRTEPVMIGVGAFFAAALAGDEEEIGEAHGPKVREGVVGQESIDQGLAACR